MGERPVDNRWTQPYVALHTKKVPFMTALAALFFAPFALVARSAGRELRITAPANPFPRTFKAA